MKIIRPLFTILTTFVALAILGVVFLIPIREWLYADGFIGNDTPQFIHYVYYHFKHPGFPINSLDYLWHNGVPRILDTSYIHFFFTTPLVKALGFYQAIKIFPLISFAIFIVFTYLIFYELSRSVLLALGMAISLVLGRGLYVALFDAGVVMSAISQAFFPIQFYFLARFHKRGTYPNLLLAGVASALGFYFHGMLMMFMGFIPSFVFVLFSTHEGEPLISKRSIKNSIVFALVALTVGALGTWPHLLLAFQGGSSSVLVPKIGPTTQVATFTPLLKFTDPGIPLAFIISFVVLFVCLVVKKNKSLLRFSLPFIAVLFYVLFWFVTYNFGLHPLAGIIFPGRFYWMWPLTLGALAAVFLFPLSQVNTEEKLIRKLPKWLGLNVVKLGVFLIIISSLLPFLMYKDLAKEMIKIEPLKTQDLAEVNRNSLQNVLSNIDQKDTNWRFWSHIQDFNMRWILVSDIPLSEGYAHIWTKRSRLWEGWFYGVMSRPNYESQEIPRDMAEKQALYFLDWYGVKYIKFAPGAGEWDLAPYIYQKEDYLDPQKSDPGKGFLRLNSSLTSGIVSPAAVPVIGFIGNDEGYMTFQKDLAALGLDTSYLIPVRLDESLGSLNSNKLEMFQALVLYNYKNVNWGKIYRFVQNGGLVWIESGGNAKEREKDNLPEVFPISKTKYGPLGADWEPGGDLASKIDFASLAKLVYKNTPWQISYSPPTAVKTGAKVLLTQKGSPVAVSQNVGKGKVIWTGVNFWYRPEEYRQNGMKEVVFVKLFLEELFGGLSQKRVQSQVERSTPEHIKVTGQGFSGVVFKENHWPGWKATVESGGKRKTVSIFTAGPELMYIPIPKDLRTGEIKVFINYKGDPFYWFTFFVSAVSLLLVAMYLISGDRLFKRLLPVVKIRESFEKVSKKTSGWWETEEE